MLCVFTYFSRCSFVKDFQGAIGRRSFVYRSRVPNHCANVIDIEEIIFQVIFHFLSLSLFPSFLVKHKLMDCFFDGNRTIRVVKREGVVYRIGTKRMHDAYAQGILRCQLADRWLEVGIYRYQDIWLPFANYFPWFVLCTLFPFDDTNLAYTRANACLFLSLFLLPFISSFFPFLFFIFFLIRSRFDQCERRINQVDLLTVLANVKYVA